MRAALLLLSWIAVGLADQIDAIDADKYNELGPLASSQAPCALNCLKSVMSTCNSSALTTACLCGADMTETDYFQCFMASCPAKEAFALQNLTASTCQWPVRDHSQRYSALSRLFTILADILIAARLIFNRFYRVRVFSPDDWVILVALPVKIGISIVNSQGMYKHGLGKDIWTLTPEEVSVFAFYIWLGVQFYLILMTLVKVILSLFLLSLFSGPILRRILWGTVVFHILAGITYSMVGAFSCTPVDYAWLQFSTESEGTCINKLASYMSYGAITVASDIWLLTVPMTQLYKLRLHWKKKIGAGIMFLLGFIGTVISIVRLRAIPAFTGSINPTQDQAEQGLFAELEVNVGFICACLPTVRLILARFFPKIFASGEARRASDATQTDIPPFHKSETYVEMKDSPSGEVSRRPQEWV